MFLKPSRESVPLLALGVCMALLIPWVTTKAKEAPPSGLEEWKQKALQLNTDQAPEIPKVKLFIKDFTSTYYPKEATAAYWVVSASEARLDKPDSLDLELPTLRVIDPTKDDATTVIRGEKGNCLTNGQFVQLKGNVRTRTYSGGYLETEDLCYDPAKGMIYTEGAYVISKDKSVLRGTGFSSDPKLTHTKFGKIHGQARPGDLNIRN